MHMCWWKTRPFLGCKKALLRRSLHCQNGEKKRQMLGKKRRKKERKRSDDKNPTIREASFILDVCSTFSF